MQQHHPEVFGEEGRPLWQQAQKDPRRRLAVFISKNGALWVYPTIGDFERLRREAQVIVDEHWGSLGTPYRLCGTVFRTTTFATFEENQSLPAAILLDECK